MQMLDMLDAPSAPATRLERVRASWHEYAPRVLAVAGSLWGKAILGVAAAATLGGTVWHFAHRKPVAHAIMHERPIHAGPVHTHTAHKHTATHPPHHKATHKKAKSHKKHPAVS